MNNVLSMKCLCKSGLIFLLLFTIQGCASKKNMQKIMFSGQAQGTYYAITYYDENGRNFQPQVDSLLKEFDKIASLWVPASQINKINNNEDVKLNPMFIDMLEKSNTISEVTNGAFDITVGGLVKAWGFSIGLPENMNQHIVDSLMQFVGYKKVWAENNSVKKEYPQVTIDFNAIAQGYTSDIIGDMLIAEGIENFIVDVGGEVLAKGTKPNNQPWVVGIEKPTETKDDDRKIMEGLKLMNASLVTSGNYRKYYEKDGVRYSHTINPHTGYPVQHTLLSVSVLAEKAWEADALATAFMVMGMEKALDFLNKNTKYEAYFIYDQNGTMKVYMTEGMKKLIMPI